MKNITWKRVAMVAMLTIAILIAFSAGFASGSFQSLKWCMGIAVSFFNIEDIEFDSHQLAQMIFNYKNRIVNCFSPNKT